LELDGPSLIQQMPRTGNWHWTCFPRTLCQAAGCSECINGVFGFAAKS
jgi:hypothetical protein